MTRGWFDGLLLLLLGSLLFMGLGTFCERVYPTSMIDFKVLYYPTQCLLQHHDPYAKNEVLHLYQAEGGYRQLDPPKFLQMVSQSLYLPSALVVTAPIALLPWGPAHFLWMVLTAAGLIFAAFLMWELGANYAPIVPAGLIGLLLLGSELLLEVGNAAGIAVSLCVIAAWCFLRERFTPAGILCFALSLAIKPHVAGPVWLYFLLAGGTGRRRALQTLAVAAIVNVTAVLWVFHVAPHFPAELRANLRAISAHGNMSDPGPAGFDPQFHGAIMVSLQTVVSVFRDDPRFYNLITYLLCAPFLSVWMFTAFRGRFSQESAWFALAAMAPLSMLPIYHRLHDTSLLLLIFPGFTLLWAERGVTAWLALVLTSAGTIMTNDFLVRRLAIYGAHLRDTTPWLPGQLLTVVLIRPVPLALLAMGAFYLWAYARHSCTAIIPTMPVRPEKGPSVS